ncbi:hypothetical protein PBY51_001893 [Eleginops maclovinus]|uniref:Uncharacterized protein n=1 Tax=Eleginops maclovinus TaxID=56733 RepID=A0AAN8ACS8_ELEMC|nr:hypothetical protein PBY51_001893 [Eleginops maclovinus]
MLIYCISDNHERSRTSGRVFQRLVVLYVTRAHVAVEDGNKNLIPAARHVPGPSGYTGEPGPTQSGLGGEFYCSCKFSLKRRGNRRPDYTVLQSVKI